MALKQMSSDQCSPSPRPLEGCNPDRGLRPVAISHGNCNAVAIGIRALYCWRQDYIIDARIRILTPEL